MLMHGVFLYVWNQDYVQHENYNQNIEKYRYIEALCIFIYQENDNSKQFKVKWLMIIDTVLPVTLS